MPYPVPGMTQSEPQQVDTRDKQRPGRRVPCGKPTSATQERSTLAPPASTFPSASGASTSTDPALPSSSPAASPTLDVALALGQIMEGINAMNVRLTQTEQASV